MTPKQVKLADAIERVIRIAATCRRRMDAEALRLSDALLDLLVLLQDGVAHVPEFSFTAGGRAGQMASSPSAVDVVRRAEVVDVRKRLDAEAGAALSLKPLASGGGIVRFNGENPFPLAPLKFRLLQILCDQDPHRHVTAVGDGWRLVSEVRRALGILGKPMSATHFRNVVSDLRQGLRAHGINDQLLATQRGRGGKTKVRLRVAVLPWESPADSRK